jgi:hypothetical protein
MVRIRKAAKAQGFVDAKRRKNAAHAVRRGGKRQNKASPKGAKEEVLRRTKQPCREIAK